MTSTRTAGALRAALLMAACCACVAEGIVQHHASAGSLRGDSGSSSGDLANSRGGPRDTGLSLSSSPLRSASPAEDSGAKLSLSAEEAIYPPPSAKGSSWRFDLKHSVSPSPSRGRGASPRTRSCARCNSVEGMDAGMEDGLEKVNLRMDFSHISV